ncbi:thiosulfate sulfurtransferase [Mycobacterium tuberculosis]|nr:thiosulfate sulfurtransferase [Mycobacterium tuberculosis]
MARCDVLVSADWAESNLHAPKVVFVEVDEDTSAYDRDHIAGAIKLDWRTDLQDPVKRDFVDAQQFSKLLSERGIANEDTVILYGAATTIGSPPTRTGISSSTAMRSQVARRRPQEVGARRSPLSSDRSAGR